MVVATNAAAFYPRRRTTLNKIKGKNVYPQQNKRQKRLPSTK
jgi:hypothetical protein